MWQECGGAERTLTQDANAYLAHVERGRPIRQIAREAGLSPSTVLRRVRRIEARRDDPLVDEALCLMAAPRLSEDTAITLDTPTIEREARRVLRRLAEPGAVLALAKGLDTAAVLREGAGAPTRTATVPRDVARAFAMRGWIGCDGSAGRVTRYRLAAAGRTALKSLTTRSAAEAEPAAPRYAVESPLSILARRRERGGRRFLTPEAAAAGERLREDWDLASVTGETADAMLAEALDGSPPRVRSGGGPEEARVRVLAALHALGPDLADVALRTCCLLEGIETAERRMGWSARSGKIVLRIALGRLHRHYVETEGTCGGMIG